MLTPANVGVMSAADFVAGFMFGMTGQNHLTEIEACYQGGELMVGEIETGVADFKKGGTDNIMQGILEFGLVALQVPQTLTTCKGMDEDVAAIKSWASIFKNPTALAAKISKDMLLHRKEMQADISAVESDWTAGNYFKSGNDLATLMILAFGPIEPAAPVNVAALPPVDPFVPDFTAGLIYAFTGNDHKSELEGCMTDLEPLGTDLEQVLADIKGLHFVKVAQDLGNFIWMLPDAVSTCGELTQLEADLQEMLDWAEMLRQPEAVAKTVSKNWLFHGVSIKKHMNNQKADYASADYYGTGEETGEIALTLLPKDSVKYFNALPPIDPFVADFTAGLIMGFTGNDRRADLEGCMKDVEPLAKDIKSVLGDLTHFHIIKVVGDLGNFMWMLPDAVEECEKLTELNEDMGVMLEWASLLKQPIHVAEVAAKHWTFHGVEIKADIEKTETDYAAADYYNAGLDASHVALGLVPLDTQPKLALEMILN